MLGLAAFLAVQAALPLPIVAIDPGHGGDQPGAIGVCGITEKDVARNVSDLVASFLTKSGKATPYLVRVGDETLSLDERSARANDQGAAVFISIHANASQNAEARGVETYFLTRTAADHRLNKLVLRENDGQAFPPAGVDDSLTKILDGLILQAAHQESQRLGVRVQEAMETAMGTSGRGLLQAPFIVLRGAHMSAVLVELGFLSNEEDCALLADPARQQTIARALTSAILEHLANDNANAARQ